MSAYAGQVKSFNPNSGQGVCMLFDRREVRFKLRHGSIPRIHQGGLRWTDPSHIRGKPAVRVPNVGDLLLLRCSYNPDGWFVCESWVYADQWRDVAIGFLMSTHYRVLMPPEYHDNGSYRPTVIWEGGELAASELELMWPFRSNVPLVNGHLPFQWFAAFISGEWTDLAFDPRSLVLAAR